MFSAPKLAKTKPLTAPAYSSMDPKKKYVPTSTNNGGASSIDLCNRSFDTAHSLLYQSNDGRSQQGSNNLRQTRLGIRKRADDEENHEPATSNKSTKKTTEFFLLPLPNKEKISTKKTQKEAATKQMERTNDIVNSNPMAKNGRNAVVLLGKIDFCLKMHKLYPNTNALWNAFGKLLKIIEGKNRFEQNLLLRNTSNDGPVLKCFYYDFDNEIIGQIHVGETLRVVGRFQNQNHFHVYKVEKLSFENKSDDFSRIQNVISFVLLQKHTQETDDK